MALHIVNVMPQGQRHCEGSSLLTAKLVRRASLRPRGSESVRSLYAFPHPGRLYACEPVLLHAGCNKTARCLALPVLVLATVLLTSVAADVEAYGRVLRRSSPGA